MPSSSSFLFWKALQKGLTFRNRRITITELNNNNGGFMTKNEAAIVSAYTGIMLGEFSDMHEYAEKIMGHPIWTHQFGNKEFVEKFKEAARNDFINLEVK